LKTTSGYRVLLDRGDYLDPNSEGEFPGVDWMLITNRSGHVEHAWETKRP